MCQNSLGKCASRRILTRFWCRISIFWQCWCGGAFVVFFDFCLFRLRHLCRRKRQNRKKRQKHHQHYQKIETRHQKRVKIRLLAHFPNTDHVFCTLSFFGGWYGLRTVGRSVRTNPKKHPDERSSLRSQLKNRERRTRGVAVTTSLRAQILVKNENRQTRNIALSSLLLLIFSNAEITYLYMIL